MLVAAGVLAFAAAVPNLSGTWKLNIGASDWNKKEKPRAPVVLTIEHQEPRIKVSGIVPQGDEESNTFLFEGAIDGRGYSSDHGKRSLRRVDDRTIDSTWKSDDGRYVEHSRTRLSRDGKRLTREIDLRRPDGEFKWTEVYDKQ